jgi:hypothetical protein
MGDIYLGDLKKQMSKAGNEYFKGWFGKVPIIAFWGKKDTSKINIKLDVDKAKWMTEQEEQTNAQKAQAKIEEPDDLPF